MNGTIRVAKIDIRNIAGIEHLEIAPGRVTKITGDNGVGKTSVLDALKALLGGGHDASLVREGQKSGEVVLVLDDGDHHGAITLRKRITEKGSALEVRGADGKVLPNAKPQTLVDSLFDSIAVNPVALLNAPASTRAQILLETLPISVTAEEIKACGAVVPKDLDLTNGLDAIAAVRKAVYDERTGQGQLLRQAEGYVATLERSILEVVDVPDVAAAQNQLMVIQSEQQRFEARAHEVERGLAEDARRVMNDTIAEARKVFDAACEEARRVFEEERHQCASHKEAAIEAQARKTADEAAELTALIRTAAEKQKLATAAEINRRNLEEARKNMRAYQDRITRATSTLEALDKLKSEKAEKLPIPGVEVRGKEAFIDGRPWDRANTARRVQVVLAVAKLRAGKVPLVVVDGLECLSSETFAAFEEQALASPLQFVVSRVTEGELAVETLG